MKVLRITVNIYGFLGTITQELHRALPDIRHRHGRAGAGINNRFAAADISRKRGAT
jgi:hypothetical protein